MNHNDTKVAFTVLAMLIVVGTAGCGGSKVLREPQALVLAGPLTSKSSDSLEAHLDWVIVRAGPGTWASNADWDEYLLRVRNTSELPIRVTGAAVYDSLGTRVEASRNRKQLIKASRDTARRYKSEGLVVKAGFSGSTLMAASGVALLASEAMALSVLSGSASYGTAGAAVGTLALVPVLAVSGVVRSVNNSRVSQEIAARHTPLPFDIAPAQERTLHVFFPLAPSPSRIELAMIDGGGERLLSIDTRGALQGLHLGDAGPPQGINPDGTL